MLKKPRKVSKTTLQKKADQLLQELGRELNKKCIVCGGPYSCLHHYVKKSQSTALRYDLDNCIPLCHSCHSSIHVNLNDLVAGRIALMKGQEWVEGLERKKRLGAGKNYGIGFYQNIIEGLRAALG